MTNITTIARRAFLLGRAAGALATAGTASVTAIAATRPAPAMVTESPELIDAGRGLYALQAEWQAAQALRLEAGAHLGGKPRSASTGRDPLSGSADVGDRPST